MNRTLNFLAGVMCGALVGAVTALLLAPASGEELQAQMKGEFSNMVEDARRVAQERRTEMENALRDLRGESGIKID